MKFKYSGGLLYLPITVFYDQPIDLIAMIDTGSAGTAVNVNLFDIDMLSRSGHSITLHGIGGTQDAFVQTVSSVKIGTFEIKDFEVEFCDIEKDHFGFEAIIGSNLLDALNAVIDYSKREINFST